MSLKASLLTTVNIRVVPINLPATQELRGSNQHGWLRLKACAAAGYLGVYKTGGMAGAAVCSVAATRASHPGVSAEKTGDHVSAH